MRVLHAHALPGRAPRVCVIERARACACACAGSEIVYCILSLTAKLYLGLFLLVNILMTDGTVEQSLAPAEL